jgi:hypothetical protein
VLIPGAMNVSQIGLLNALLGFSTLDFFFIQTSQMPARLGEASNPDEAQRNPGQTQPRALTPHSASLHAGYNI